MAAKRGVLAMVMAGGKGERLYPLTLERTKPSVPFGGKYRIIDFALSNFVNSGIYSIYVLVQYKSQSLIEHIRSGWKREGMLTKHFITVVPPQMRSDIKDWYRGTADSIYQNINLIYDYNPKFVVIFGGDHIYRMNIREMIDFHVKMKAKVTIASAPIRIEEAGRFGILDTDNEGKVSRFIEKPESLDLPKGKDICFASMGNYIFDAETLLGALLKDTKDKVSHHDFGRDVIPSLIKEGKSVFAYDFSKNRIPGLKKYEVKGYWRDVGTIESYWQANRDLLGDKPVLDLDNQSWPIYASSYDCPPAKIDDCDINNSLISEGCHIRKAKISNSILGRSLIIEEGCVIEDSIIMDFSVIKKGCKIKKAVIDRFNIVNKNTHIGFDSEKDASKYYRDNSGITVLKRGPRRAFYW